MTKLSLLLTAALAATATAQQFGVPAIFATTEGGTSGNIWRAGTNRVQCFYAASDFEGAGIGHPIEINNLEWRLAGGLAGAAVNYPSVEIYLQQSASSYLSPSTTFATNRTVAHPTTPNYAGAVNVNTASGTTPNDWVINIPLTNNFTYYPDQGDLLLEIVILVAPTPVTGSTMSTGFNVTSHRCNSVRSVGSTTAVTGSLSAFAPVVRLGYTDVPGGARHVVYGDGCVTHSRSFYEEFAINTADLGGNTVTMAQNGLGGYTVNTTAGATVVPPTATGLALGDDVVSAAIPLPFTFDYPGGSTSSIYVDSNGSILLNGTAASNIGGSAVQLLTSPVHRLSPSMQDLLPDGTTNVANVFAEPDPANPTTVFLITWLNVPCFGGTAGGSTFQVALIDNGSSDSVEMRYSTLINDSTSVSGVAVTGFSLGGTATDPGNRDLTAGSFATEADVSPLSLKGSPRPIMGQPVIYTVDNVRAVLGLSALYLSVGNTTPIPLTAYGLNAPGCFGHINLLNSIALLTFAGSPTVLLPITWPTGPYSGLDLYLQVFSLAPSENPAGVISSNGLQVKLGTL
ncbi:MAG: hypothetical protein R3F56_14770 [Planctomycetota bacterium]